MANPYLEEIRSQIPAVQLLANLGWTYLTPAEALHLRGSREKNVILTGVLEPWLRHHNQIRYKGQIYPFSDNNIILALARLVNRYRAWSSPTRSSTNCSPWAPA
jgi:type I restriction enzyme, R subunit